MFIAVTNDSNKYYRTWSTNEMQIDNCICVIFDILPNQDSEDKNQFCRLIESATNEVIPVQAFDENGQAIYKDILDIFGNIIGQEPVTKEGYKEVISYEWLFDEVNYNKYLDSITMKPSAEERLQAVEEQTATVLLSLIMNGMI